MTLKRLSMLASVEKEEEGPRDQVVLLRVTKKELQDEVYEIDSKLIQ